MVRSAIAVCLVLVVAWMVFGPVVKPSFSAPDTIQVGQPLVMTVAGAEAALPVEVNGAAVKEPHLRRGRDSIVVAPEFLAQFQSDSHLAVKVGAHVQVVEWTGVRFWPPVPVAVESRDLTSEVLERARRKGEIKSGLFPLNTGGDGRVVIGIDEAGVLRAGPGMPVASRPEDMRTASVPLLGFQPALAHGDFEVTLQYASFDRGCLALNIGEVRILLPYSASDPCESLVQAPGAVELVSTCLEIVDHRPGQEAMIKHGSSLLRGEGLHNVRLACHCSTIGQVSVMNLELQIDDSAWSFRVRRSLAPRLRVLIEGICNPSFAVSNVRLTRSVP